MNLSRQFAVLCMCFFLESCAQNPPRDISAERKFSVEAVKSFIDFGKANVNKVDDNISDASTVALALELACENKYMYAM